MVPQFIDFPALDRHITEVAARYEKTAPVVSNYAEDVYLRLNEAPHTVSVTEIQFLARLIEDGTWMQPNYAANQLLHHFNRIGRDTTGLAGF